MRITLTAQSSASLSIPIREFWLSPSDSPMPIGRTSKVEAKNYLASPDNAWFDSPVMSRKHAELSVDKDTKVHTHAISDVSPPLLIFLQTVYMKDLGSTHGTFINGEEHPLKKDEFRALRDGDRARFGVPIFRGSDTFPPADIQVGIHHTER